MMARLGMIDDKELREQVSRLKDKLNTMNDEEFMKVDFSVYEEDENEQMG